MLRRVLGVSAVVCVTLLSWGAVSQPTRSGPPVQPAPPRAPIFRPGIAPAPQGSAGRYELRHLRTQALFTDRGVELRLPSRTQASRTLGWSVAGGRAVTPRVEKPREAKLHRLVGPTASWEREVPTYGGLRYPGVLPGVELWFEERAEGVEYGFRAERGADLRRVTLEYAGAQAVRVVEEGRALEVDLGEDVLREEGLHCMQEQADGMPKAVGCRFTDVRALGRERWAYAIEVDVEDPERPVVVDPLVLWNTYLGGPGEFDGLRAIQQNAAGELLVAGTVGAAPDSARGQSSLFGVRGGPSDVLVARFQADGTLAWWTVFGGQSYELVSELVLGDAEELYVSGTTGSPELQWLLADGGTGISKAYSLDGPDGFVARLDPSGKQLEWFLHVGGNGNDIISDTIRGPQGRLFLAGSTTSNGMMDAGFLPDAGPVVSEDGFITRFDPGQRKAEWTLLIQQVGNNDDGSDGVMGLTARADGSLYAAGYYSDFAGGVTNGFVSRISGVNGGSPSASAPLRIGGNRDEYAVAVTLPADGAGDKLLVWGNTTSSNFPGHTPVQGGSDIFVSTVGDDGGTLSLQRTALLGGSGTDVLSVVKTDSLQRVYLGGYTTSSGLRVDGGFDTALEDNSQGDGFVARMRLEPEPAFEWFSYVGGSGKDNVLTLHVDHRDLNRLYIGGDTTSQDLRYADAGFDTSANGAFRNNMFLMAVDLNATPGGGTTPDGGGGGTNLEMEPLSPLGWSCGASGTSGGAGAFALGTLAGLGLLVFRRKRTLRS